MTNEELRTKIVEILEETEYEWTEEKNGYILQIFYDKLADALIAAGIGDLKEHRIFAGKDGSIKQLYSDEEVEDIARQRDEYKHRALVAERALESACQDIISTIEFICEAGGVVTVENYSPEKATPQAYLKRAERELAEERKDGKLE